jgi:molybdopterin synthase catalytic subunit
MIRITQDPLNAAELLRGFCQDRLDTGAVVSFTGLTRGRTDDRAVDALTLEAYPGFTERVMEEIEVDARARFEIQDILAVHRWGTITVGEPVIFVAVAAAHRRPAFEAADFLMDHFKTRAPFWKREDGPEGRRWIEPRDQDHADLARWAEETR